MTTKSNHIAQIVANLPESPGVYQYLDKTGTIIYVGKAKNLKRRVSSYFNKNQDRIKTRILVSKIVDLKYIVVNSEEEALLLENNLIKKHQPRYNILLKDGKTYPSVCIRREPFPRVFVTRNIIKDGSEYFGPFSNVNFTNYLVEYFHEIFQLRTCKLDLSDSNIDKKYHKVCLEYHIKKCAGCCQGLESKESYNQKINQIREILKGNIHIVVDDLKSKMQELASELKFEEAQVIKENYDKLLNFQSKWTVVNPKISNVDVFSIIEDEEDAFVNFLTIRNGAIVQAYTIEYKKRIDESKEEILSLAIIELRERFKSYSKEILVPFEMEMELENVEFIVPKIGDKKRLLDLSEKNAKQYKLDKLKREEKLNPEQRTVKLLTSIQQALQLKELPMTIECFDNSNISGTSAVASCIVFKKGKPSKKDYRHFNIKTVEGPDDYASMQEVVFRRYSRLIEEEKELPNLIITDGGKGQMESVREIIEDQLHLNIPIAGLAKDDKHRTKELLFGFPPKVVELKVNDELFKLLANIQDEAHRFAITFHRNKRSKNQIKSELDEIKGIGQQTKELLLKHFKSVKRIKNANFEEIKEVVGNKKAEIITNFFKQ